MINRWLLLVGALQGWVLWGLWKARELKVWPATDTASERTLLYLGLALPLAIYFTQGLADLARGRRLRLVGGLGVLFALLGAYSGWAENVAVDLAQSLWSLPPARPTDLAAAAVLGFVAVPLWAHLRTGRLPLRQRWSYHALFETAWRNGLLSASSAALTGIFWIVLFAGAMLMKSIGVNFVFELIEKSIFAIPVTGIVFGAAFALGLARGEMMVALRRFFLSISAWLLPLLLAFSVAWVVALPFTGLELLFKTHNAALILLWFLALSIGFANAAYQDGSIPAPYGPWLSRPLEIAWLTLLVLVGVAGWALKLRIAQYGWSEDRVWAVFVLFMVTLHTVGYALSLWRRDGWLARIGQTNVCAALAMALGLLVLLSPLGDTRRIAVDSQMQRLLARMTPTDKIDYAYLRWQAGRYGRDALETLAAGVDHTDRDIIASKAKQTLAQKNRYAREDAATLTAAQLRQRLRVLPAGEIVGDALLNTLLEAGSTQDWQKRRCLATDAQCLVLMVDLDDDGLKDAVIVVEKPDWQFNTAVVYRQAAPERFVYGGTIDFVRGTDVQQRKRILADLEQGRVGTAPSRFNDLTIGEHRYSVNAETK